MNWIAWLFAAPAIALALAAALLGSQELQVWSSLCECLLYFYSVGALIAYMLQDDEVTTDELFAAGATFTLLAWGFAYAYFVCQAWYPGSFGAQQDPDFTAHLAGAALPQLHHALGRGPGRHHPALLAGARAGDAGGVRGRGLHRRDRLAPDRPDDPRAL